MSRHDFEIACIHCDTVMKFECVEYTTPEDQLLSSGRAADNLAPRGDSLAAVFTPHPKTVDQEKAVHAADLETMAKVGLADLRDFCRKFAAFADRYNTSPGRSSRHNKAGMTNPTIRQFEVQAPAIDFKIDLPDTKLLREEAIEAFKAVPPSFYEPTVSPSDIPVGAKFFFAGQPRDKVFTMLSAPSGMNAAYERCYIADNAVRYFEPGQLVVQAS